MKAETFVAQATIIYTQMAFYLIGGSDNNGSFYYNPKTIGRMDLDGQWTRAGELNQPREGHNVIYDGKYLMIIGGEGVSLGVTGYQTEKCLIRKNGSVLCTTQNPILDGYTFYPELLLVSDDFCKY